jgi:outer membrane protein insertion porin family
MRGLGLVVAVAACAHAPARSRLVCGGAEALPPAARVDPDELLARPAVAGATITRVAVRGPASLADVDLDGAILTRAGAPYDAARIAEDVRRLWRLGVLDDVRVAVTREGAGVAVAFDVDAAPVVRRVALSDLPDDDGARAAHLRAMAGAIYDPMRVHRAAHRLGEELLSAGHLKATVAVGATRVAPGLVDVCVAADAGRRYVIDRIEFPGATRLAPSALLPLVRRAKGDIDAPGGAYRAELLDEDLVRISAAYYDAGMVMAKVGTPTVAIDERRARLVVRVPIDEGPVYRVGRITMKGVPSADEATYRRALRVSSGEVFARGALAGGLERLRALERERGHRGDVEPETAIDDHAHVIDLTIEVTP